MYHIATYPKMHMHLGRITARPKITVNFAHQFAMETIKTNYITVETQDIVV